MSSLHGLLSCSRLRVWCFMSGCRVPAFGCGASWLAVVLPASGVRGFMACCHTPASGWVGEPRGLRPHIAAGHPGRGTHPLPSAAALSLVNRSCKESLLDAIALIVNYLGIPLGMAFTGWYSS